MTLPAELIAAARLYEATPRWRLIRRWRRHRRYSRLLVEDGEATIWGRKAA